MRDDASAGSLLGAVGDRLRAVTKRACLRSRPEQRGFAAGPESSAGAWLLAVVVGLLGPSCVWPAAARKTCFWWSTRPVGPRKRSPTNTFVCGMSRPKMSAIWTGMAALKRPISPPFAGRFSVPVLAKLQQRGPGRANRLHRLLQRLSDGDHRPRSNSPARSSPIEIYPTASINSATFLWQNVLAQKPRHDRPGEQPLHANRRRGHGLPPGPRIPLVVWLGTRRPIAGGRRPALLSLDGAGRHQRAGQFRERGDPLSHRSAKADGTHPSGTIYYMQNSDVRSTIRDAGFPAAVAALKKLGVRAVVESGTVPNRRPDVQGLMTGTREIHWSQSGSTILPGALCEHFTSFAGVMTEGTAQTPLSELLRYGAAGASGHRRRTLLDLAESVGSGRASLLRLGLHAGRSVVSIGVGPLSTAHRGRPAVPSLGQHPASQQRCRSTRRHAERDRRDSSRGDICRRRRRNVPAAIPPIALRSYELYVDGRRIAWATPGNPLRAQHPAPGRRLSRAADCGDRGGSDRNPRPRDPDGAGRQPRPHDRLYRRPRSSEPSAAQDTTDKTSTRSDKASLCTGTKPLVLTAKAPGMAEIVFSHNGRVLGRTEQDEAQPENQPAACWGPAR